MNDSLERGRRIFIGDVQGCRDELCALLDAVEFTQGVDRLHLVGDLINRGPASAAVLRLARELEASCVLGNHEVHRLTRGAFEADANAEDHPHCVDLATAPDRVELGAWVATWPWIRDLGDILLVHAAVPPSLWNAETFTQPCDDERKFAISVRYCDAQGRRAPSDWPPPGPPWHPWHHFYEAHWTVVYGHWARQGLHREGRFRGLDTGCVYGRVLTAWIAEEDRIVQVPARRRYA